MAKICDNTSAATIVKDGNGRILMIERKKYNPGFALPAGHQDGNTPEDAARRELSEEVGLKAGKMKIVFTRDLPNPCKREGGSHHFWTVFEIEDWSGEVRSSEDEVKKYLWADSTAISEMARKLENFMVQNNLSFDDFPALVRASNESEEWKADPGLEPAMYPIFKTLGLI